MKIIQIWNNCLISQPIFTVEIPFHSVFYTQNDDINEYGQNMENSHVKNLYETLILYDM